MRIYCCFPLPNTLLTASGACGSGGVVGGRSNVGLSCLLCCSILLEHPDPLLQAEGITNFQRIHVFAPHLVNLALFAPFLLVSFRLYSILIILRHLSHLLSITRLP